METVRIEAKGKLKYEVGRPRSLIEDVKVMEISEWRDKLENRNE